MNNKGFTIVEIMIVVAIIALLAAIAIPNLMQARITSNTTAAKANVRSLSTAAEMFSIGHSGVYPADVTELTTTIASAGQYCNQTTQGYIYSCVLSSSDYTISAAPVSAQTGSTTYTATTGGVLTPL